MTSLYYSISEKVFASYPGYARGVVLAYDVTNRESPKELVDLLREAETQLRLEVTVETIADHPRIHA